MRKKYTDGSVFQARWCPNCHHAFSLEYQRGYQGAPDQLLSAAAQEVTRDNVGEPSNHFVLVTHCPTCGAECTPEWAESTLTISQVQERN